MTSPLCLVNGLATTNGVDVTPGTTVTIQLIDTAGVNTWEISCIGTDDLLTTDDINDTLSIIDVTAKTATFTMPNDDGYAVILRSRVNLGVDINGRTVSSYTTTFKVATLINSNRTIAVNEQMESSAAYGWAKPVNNIIRAALSSGFDLGGDLSGTLPDPTVEKIKGTSITTAGGALIDGYVLTVTGVSSADWERIPDTLTGDVVGTFTNNTCTLAGDVTGRTGVTVVGKVKGSTITTAGGALSTGAVLRVTGASTADWGQVNLADTDAITGTLPLANRPNPIYAAAAIALMNPLSGPSQIDLSDGYTNLSNGITISTASNNLTVITAGAYRIFVSLYCDNSGALTDDIVFAFYKNGVAFTEGISQFNQFFINIPIGVKAVSAAFECVASLAASDVIDVRVTNTSVNGPDARRIFGGVFGMTLL